MKRSVQSPWGQQLQSELKSCNSSVTSLLSESFSQVRYEYRSSFLTSSTQRCLVLASEPVPGETVQNFPLPPRNTQDTCSWGFFPAPGSPWARGAFCSWVYSCSILGRPLCQDHHQSSSEGTLVPELFVCQGFRGSLVSRDPWHQFISI